jgi:hypothetical protein
MHAWDDCITCMAIADIVSMKSASGVIEGSMNRTAVLYLTSSALSLNSVIWKISELSGELSVATKKRFTLTAAVQHRGRSLGHTVHDQHSKTIAINSSWFDRTAQVCRQSRTTRIGHRTSDWETRGGGKRSGRNLGSSSTNC